MKNGDTIRLEHTFEVLPLVHAAFTAEDTPLNTIEDLKALLDRIDGEVPADTVVDIYLPPVTYTGDLHISSRAVNLYGCCDGSGRTVIEGSLTVSTHVPDKVVLHDLDFVGNGGNGLTATASTMIENCSFTGYDIGAAVKNGGMIGVEACTFRNNKIGFSYDTLRYSFSKDGFPDCRIEGNDVGIQFVNLPGAMPLDFFGTVFPETERILTIRSRTPSICQMRFLSKTRCFKFHLFDFTAKRGRFTKSSAFLLRSHDFGQKEKFPNTMQPVNCFRDFRAVFYFLYGFWIMRLKAFYPAAGRPPCQSIHKER